MEHTHVYVALIAAASTILVTHLKEHYYPKKKHEYLSVHKSESYIKLDKLCNVIREKTKADGVYIAGFHNGGTFISGLKMDKYTVLGEDYGVNLRSYKSKYKDILVNTCSYLFHSLLVSNRYGVCDSKEYNKEDQCYVDDLKARDVSSAYTFLIKHPITGSPLGFISLEFHVKDGFQKSEERHIWKHHNEIANLLTTNKKK